MKETRLDDSAEIYQNISKQNEKEKLSEMSWKEKFSYFNTYYRNMALIAIVIIAVFVCLMVAFLSPKSTTILYTAIINEYFDKDKEAEFIDGLNDYFSPDSKKEELVWDSSFYISETNPSQATMSNEQKLAGYLGTWQLDVMIADEEKFSGYAQDGYFNNLAEQLPTDLYSRLSDDLYLEKDPENPDKLIAYGISLKNCPKYQELEGDLENPVLGLVINSKNAENAVRLIRYLYDE